LGLVSPADLAQALAQWLFRRLLLKFLSFSFFSSSLLQLSILNTTGVTAGTGQLVRNRDLDSTV